MLLKVAQPVSAAAHENHIEIGDAAYVSFAGTKLKRAIGSPALRLVVAPAARTT